MSRRFTSGFELQGLANGIEWYASEGQGTQSSLSISTAVSASGAASLRCLNPASVRNSIANRFGAVATGVSLFLRVKIRIDVLPNASTTIGGFGGTLQPGNASFRLNTDGTLTLFANTGGSLQNIGTSAAALPTGAWQRIELRFMRGATPNAGADELDLKVNGTTVVTTAAATAGSAAPTRMSVGVNLGNSETCSTLDLYYDDVAVNDSGGAVQNSWPGDGSIVALRPNAAGEFENNVTLGGSSPAATAWESTDDAPAPNDDIDYFIMSTAASTWASAGSRVAVALGSMPAAPTSVTLVTLGLRVSNFSATGSAVSTSVQTQNAGTRAADVASGSFTSAAAEWLLNNAAATRAFDPPTFYVAPQSGAAWTEAEINALQLMIRASDATPPVNVSALWAMVEFIPGAGGIVRIVRSATATFGLGLGANR